MHIQNLKVTNHDRICCPSVHWFAFYYFCFIATAVLVLFYTSFCSYLVVVPQQLNLMIVPFGQLPLFSCIFTWTHLNYFAFSSFSVGLKALHCRNSFLTKEESSWNRLDWLICTELFKIQRLTSFISLSSLGDSSSVKQCMGCQESWFGGLCDIYKHSIILNGILLNTVS